MTLREQITELVAKAAGEQNVGSVEGADPAVFGDDLCDGVFDGLEDAFTLAHSEHPNYIEHSEDEVTDEVVADEDDVA